MGVSGSLYGFYEEFNTGDVSGFRLSGFGARSFCKGCDGQESSRRGEVLAVAGTKATKLCPLIPDTIARAKIMKL